MSTSYNIDMNEKELLLKLGQKIRFERTKRGMSQEKLAELANLNFRSVSYIECGSHNVKFITIAKIAEALKIDISSLVNFTL